ncbi:MAG: TetR/AcrR family transcriptional regulator [Burkholderiales bacterium]|nr:TetR/AcrR family transcriptional regulator [Burkholderiales bacterium]
MASSKQTPRRGKRAPAAGASAPAAAGNADAPAARRAQGRPPRADAESTRARLIAATRALLHASKPAGITRFDIARAAGVDPGLVRYYFGNKAAVFDEVIRAVTAELAARRQNLPTTGPVIERLRAYLGVWLEVFTDNPHFHELVVEQVFYGEGKDARERVRRFVERAYPELASLLAEGVASGELRATEPRFVYVAIIALCEFFATGTPLVEALFGRRGAARRLRAEYGAFAADLLIDGLRAGRRPGAATPR